MDVITLLIFYLYLCKTTTNAASNSLQSTRDNCLPDIIQRCPSPLYTYCATTNGETCKIPASVEQGYISYGASGFYNFISFSNTHHSLSHHKGKINPDFEVPCNDDFGDVYPGHQKYCCYISINNGYPDPSESGYSRHKHQGDYYLNGFFRPQVARFGQSNRFIYQVFSGKLDCNYHVFNDPFLGYNKFCQIYRLRTPYTFPQDEYDWKLCGNEGKDCTGLSPGASWIRFGNNGYFYYRYVISRKGTIPCNVHQFEDPLPSSITARVSKYCWRAKSSKVSNPVGKWQLVQRCSGCEAHEYKKVVGVRRQLEEETVDAWRRSFDHIFDGGFVYMGGRGTVKINERESREIIKRMKHSLLQTYRRNQHFICSSPALYQWVTHANERNGLGLGDIVVFSDIYVCGDREPLCPPGFCLDVHCLQCSIHIEYQQTAKNERQEGGFKEGEADDNLYQNFRRGDGRGENMNERNPHFKSGFTKKSTKTRDAIETERRKVFGDRQKERYNYRDRNYKKFGVMF